MKITCPSCCSENVHVNDFEGGGGEVYIEHWVCDECNDYWEEYYTLRHEEDEY